MDIATKVEFVTDEVAIFLSLWLRGEAFFPLPLVEELFGEGEAIRHTFRVETSTGIAIPVPCTSYITTGFDDFYA